MTAAPGLVTIAISSYNNMPYLSECVESALRQDYCPVQVVVVDDGSSDGSRLLLERYGDRIDLLCKENGGQASAYNAALGVAEGSVIIFLDGDDTLYLDAVTRHIAAFGDASVVKSQGFLDVVDSAGKPHGHRVPSHPSKQSGSALRDLVLSRGPGAYVCPPGSGNAFRTDYVRALPPLPENRAAYADCYLMDTAPLYGDLVSLPHAVGAWRWHTSNATGSSRAHTGDSLREAGDRLADRAQYLGRVAAGLGIASDAQLWLRRNWRYQLIARLTGAPGQDAPSRLAVLGSLRWMRRSVGARIAATVGVAACLILPHRLGVRLAHRLARPEWI